MARERLYLFDTTLRDGAQTNGVDFTLHDKLALASMLDEIGIDYVEGGYPGANPLDTELFSKDRKLDTTFTAFGMTRRPGRSTSNDPGLASLLDAKADAICFVAKSWDYHVRVALETTEEENLASIRDSVQAAKAKGSEVLLDCEHFFDGYKANPDYALACAKAAYDAGARWVVLCDTNGGALPHEVEEIVADVVKHIPGDHVGIHAHNDTEQAVANSLAAVRAGARQIQGTLNGLGERCGNANLVSIIPTLKLKPEFADQFDIGVSDEKLKGLVHISRALDEILNRAPNRYAPYVGENAFATKAGIHASAILKDPATYEHIAPDAVGNKRKVTVSDQAGRANVLAELDRIGLKVDKNDPRIMTLLEEVKRREAAGYAYESADASFDLLARRTLGKVPDFFEVLQFDVNIEQRNNALGQRVTVSMAVVKVKVDDQTLISAAEGNGPVNALDVALRKDLGKYQKYIDGLKLTDYRVRILNAGTEAVTRVLIESEDETGERWATIGVSPNIIDASFQALMDSIIYKLVKSRRAGVATTASGEPPARQLFFTDRHRQWCPLAANATALCRIETCAPPRTFARGERMRETLRGRLVALQGESKNVHNNKSIHRARGCGAVVVAGFRRRSIVAIRLCCARRGLHRIGASLCGAGQRKRERPSAVCGAWSGLRARASLRARLRSAGAGLRAGSLRSRIRCARRSLCAGLWTGSRVPSAAARGLWRTAARRGTGLCVPLSRGIRTAAAGSRALQWPQPLCGRLRPHDLRMNMA